MRIGGLVLAAGEGSRFGGTKQLAPLGGRPLLEHALGAVAGLTPRVVVLGHEADAILAAVDLGGAAAVVCDGWAEGQAASLRCGVAALGEVDGVVVVLGDQPRITAAAVAAVAAAAAPGVVAARAAYGGRPGHPVLLGRPLLARVGELRGDVGFRDLLRGRGRPGGGGRRARRPGRHRHPGGAGAAMKLEQAFEVQAPIEQVWEALIDLERVAPCLPGATITEHDDDGTYHGEFKVKLGPTTAAYRGTVKIEEADEATHTATMRAKGTDKRGQGGANATIVNILTAEGDVTRVSAVTDFTITGRLARFGRGGMIEDISNRLMRDFATCLQSRIGAEPTPSGEQVTTGEEPPEAVAGAAAVQDPRKTGAVAAGCRSAAPTAARGRQADQRVLAVLRGALGPDQADLQPGQALAAGTATALGGGEPPLA